MSPNRSIARRSCLLQLHLAAFSPRVAFRLVAAVVSASPGPMGGIRSMLGMRSVLEKLGAMVIPQGFSLGVAHQAFTGDGNLADGKADAEVRSVGAALVGVTRNLSRQ
jgi:chromate reductase